MLKCEQARLECSTLTTTTIAIGFTCLLPHRVTFFSETMIFMKIVRINGRYRLQERLPSGPSHEIYFARDIVSEETIVVKLEPVEGEDHTLEHESLVYDKLNRGTGIPLVHWVGRDYGFNVMVIECLGPSLQDLFVRSRFQFAIKTVCSWLGSSFNAYSTFISTTSFTATSNQATSL